MEKSMSLILLHKIHIYQTGTWKGHGRGMSPDGNLQAGILMGVWKRDGSVFHMKSVDSVTDGINYVQGNYGCLNWRH